MGRPLIRVEVVDHADQRYETAGDWQWDRDTGELVVRVSKTADDRDAFLLAVHEIVEAFLCKIHGVPETAVDRFDEEFNKSHNLLLDEPGEDPSAPYYSEHGAAEIVERLVAREAGVPWGEYGHRVGQLFDREEL